MTSKELKLMGSAGPCVHIVTSTFQGQEKVGPHT